MCKNAQDKNCAEKGQRLDELKSKFDKVLKEPVPPSLAKLVEQLRAEEQRKE